MERGRDLKPHIGIFGRRNSGKSSLINALTGQDVAIVSPEAGTTTDPVRKSIEIFGIGPVIMIDTAGIDDTGSLGQKRIEKSFKIIPSVDAAILVCADNLFGDFEEDLIRRFDEYEVPYLILHNKADVRPLMQCTRERIHQFTKAVVLEFSNSEPFYTDRLVEELIALIPQSAWVNRSLMGDLISPNDIVLLITPIDSEAPEGRMILPQVMALRDVLDNHCISIVLRETELGFFMKNNTLPIRLAVTDSQAFERVSPLVPENILLTGFSILFARLRGDFEAYIRGAEAIGSLRSGDRVLIMESCTHRVSCEDIGRFKLPRWLAKYTGLNLEIEVVSGMANPALEPEAYRLVIQCGGCMFTRRQVLGRIKPYIDAGVPVTNYGMSIAFMHGIFGRALKPFGH